MMKQEQQMFIDFANQKAKQDISLLEFVTERFSHLTKEDRVTLISLMVVCFNKGFITGSFYQNWEIAPADGTLINVIDKDHSMIKNVSYRKSTDHDAYMHDDQLKFRDRNGVPVEEIMKPVSFVLSSLYDKSCEMPKF